MKPVYYFKNTNLLSKALEQSEINKFSNKKTLVKLHMGELKNKYFPRPDFVKEVVSELNTYHAEPFLYDTTVLYNSFRKEIKGYQKVAKIHGFSEEKIGCPVKIDDEGIPKTIENTSYEVGKLIFETNHIVAISHVKGHVASGMGGTIKNFGMGGVTRNTKRMIHHGAKPSYNKENCTFCGVCAEVCPFHAINVEQDQWDWNTRSCFGCGVCIENCSYQALNFIENNFQYLLACAAKACVDNKQVIYINDVNRIAKSCDCDPNAGPIICPDIGYLVSMDPVAVDTAALDLIQKEKKDIFQKVNHIDPYKQVKYGEKIGLGSTEYELINLDENQ